MSSVSPRLSAPISWGLLLVTAVFAYAPIVFEFSVNTWEYKPHYQHFPFVVLAAALLFVRGLAEPRGEAVPSKWWGTVLGVTAWLLLLPAFAIPSPLIGIASLILLLGALGCVVARMLGRPFPLGPWLLLWLILPPPLGLDGLAIQALQRQSSTLASYALDILGVNHLMEGNALTLPDKTLFVDEACSGIVSAVSIVACAAMYGVWRRRGGAHTLAMMGLAAGWAMLLNVVRIVAIAFAHVYAGLDWAEGLPHTMVGLTIFGCGLLALVATDWWLMAVLAEVGPRWDQLTGEPIGPGGLLVRLWDRFIASRVDSPAPAAPVMQPLWRSLRRAGSIASPLLGSMAFAAAGMLNLAYFLDRTTVVVDFPQAVELVDLLQADVMPRELAGCRLASVEHQERTAASEFAQHSVLFVYRSAEGKDHLVSCDFPYAGGWHELSVCYRGIGWQLDNRTVEAFRAETDAVPANVERDYVELDLTKPDGRLAHVAFCGFYVDGAPLVAPREAWQAKLMRALTRRDEVDGSRNSFQVQVLTERDASISSEDRQVSAALLKEASRRFRTAVAELVGVGAAN